MVFAKRNTNTLLTKFDMQLLSFPDSAVTDMQFDIPLRFAKIKTDTAFLSKNNNIKLNNCTLFITDWDELRISLYRIQTKKWENIETDKIEKLVDICEFEYTGKIIFRGFGEKSGQWIEIIFINATLNIECD